MPRKYRRLAAREEGLASECVKSFWTTEIPAQLSARLTVSGLPSRLSDTLELGAMRAYSRKARRALNATAGRGNLYHYRSGFGLGSVDTAKALGQVVVCDHSLPHPAALLRLVSASTPGDQALSSLVCRMGSLLQHDVNQADHVIVNSDFVRDTFLAEGYTPRRVHTVYLGIDDDFLHLLGEVRPREVPRKHLRLLFAGNAERRKGFHTLLDALPLITVPFRLTVAGPLQREFCGPLLKASSAGAVRYVGNLLRAQLAREMSETDCLVFPSFAEGSARVVFEALASGCFVITTVNAGSVVGHRQNGELVPAGDARQLAAAVDRLWEERMALPDISRLNLILVRSGYTQARYGESVHRLYEAFLAER